MHNVIERLMGRTNMAVNLTNLVRFIQFLQNNNKAMYLEMVSISSYSAFTATNLYKIFTSYRLRRFSA